MEPVGLPDGKPLGLIAGNGSFPFLVLEEANRRRIPVVTLAINGEADPSIDRLASPLHWVALGDLGKAVRILRDAGASRAIMAGQVKHKKVFQLLRPDRLLFKVLARLETRNTDAILKAVAKVLEEEGIYLLDSTVLLTALLAEPGPMGRKSPSRKDAENIAFGFRMAKEIARLDVGQTVVVKSKAVVAVEAMEGTDETIRRAGEIMSTSRGELAVVKVARPSQDMRFDVPVVGPRTIETMSEAGASVLALEAGKCLLLERAKILRLADEEGIAVTGIQAEESTQRRQGAKEK
jgi:DUF1009 family protein